MYRATNSSFRWGLDDGWSTVSNCGTDIVFCFQRGVGENDDDAYGDESDDSESISDGEDEEDENEGGDFDVAW